MIGLARVESYPVTIDYGRPFTEMIAASGYDHVNEYLTPARFPVHGRGVVAAKLLLLCLDRNASTDEVLHEHDSAERRPRRIAELLAFGAAEPERQRAFPIVALGEVEAYPDDYRRIPFLWGSPRVRHLDLRWDEHSWGANICFLAVGA
ncbi:MAG TPA: hypothetical protein VK496_05470 [Gaiellaceae bacterium]|nr:hypothetical protein [Gaiellaceae bacterium]